MIPRRPREVPQLAEGAVERDFVEGTFEDAQFLIVKLRKLGWTRGRSHAWDHDKSAEGAVTHQPKVCNPSAERAFLNSRLALWSTRQRSGSARGPEIQLDALVSWAPRSVLA